MVWLSGVVAYQQAEEVLRRVGHQVIPRMSIWRQGQKHGERLKRYHDHQRAAAGIERVVLSSVTPDHRRQKGISLDGGMVNIREEGWKEFKTGTVFDVVPYQVQDVQTGEKVELAGASAVRYGRIPVEWSGSSSNPQEIKVLVQDGGAKDEHALSSRARPAHARADQTGLKLLDSAFDSSGANRVGFLAELQILHAALMGTEIAGVIV